MLVRCHVDEVDDDQAADVAQAQLPGDFIRRLEVGVQSGFIDVGAAGGAGRVDVDGDEGLGGVDRQRAAGRQRHITAKSAFDLVFDLEAVEQRQLFLVQLDAVLVLRHHLAHEEHGFFPGCLGVEQHLADLGAQIVADRPDDGVAFLVDEKGRPALAADLLDRLPQLEQVVEVPLQVPGLLADPGGAHDQAHVVGDFELAQRLLGLGPLIALDAAGNAAEPGVVGHQHEIAPGEADVGG